MNRELSKTGQYGERVVQAGGTFIPFVMESYGNLGPAAAALLDHFIEKAQARSSIPLSIMKSYWTQRLVIAMRCTGMQCLHNHALNADRHSPIDLEQEIDELGVLDTRSVNCAMNFRN